MIPWIRYLLGAVLLIGCGYVVLSLVAHRFALRVLFPRPPATYGPGEGIVALTAPDGVRVVARHWPNPAARHTLLFFHGNGEDLGTVAPFAEELVAAGYAVLSYDYRGYGHSGGHPDERSTRADAELVYDHARDRLGLVPERIVIYGFSLGSGPAVHLAAERPAAGLILQSPFASAYRASGVGWLPLLRGDVFDNLARIGEVACPVFVLHGLADGIVPVGNGEALLAAAREPKRGWFVADAGHNDLAQVAGARFLEELRRFTDGL